MTYKKLTNPLESVVSINYLGRVYEIGPMDSGVFESVVADHWLGIHEFLIATEATEEVEEKVEEDKTKKSKAK